MKGGLILAAQALCFCASLQGQSTALCIEDRVHLDARTRAAFDREIDTLLPESASAGCGVEALLVVIAFDAPARCPSSLGLAYSSQARVMPKVEVFLNQVLRALAGIRAPVPVGRALARVAAHEAAHYFLQQHGHDRDGLLRERFPEWQLGADSSAPFLLVRK
ncbi:MAG: hypothetical protein EHM65_02175 [Acidobacteriales bacterium]|nr:MAG: hypothetical protein EHM65_02175 [Terriglobales bacterium]